jgi:hypothetical protein
MGTDMPTNDPDANSEHLKGVQPSPSDTSTDYRQQITDICFENGGVTKPMVDKLEAILTDACTRARMDELANAFREMNKGEFPEKLAFYDARMAELHNQSNGEAK